MSFFQKNSSPMLPNQTPQRRESQPKKPASKQDKLLFWLTLGCTVLSTLFYFTVVSLSQSLQVIGDRVIAKTIGVGIMIFYAVAAAAFLVVFIIYNRAFTRDNVTPEMLPDSMSEHQKLAFIQNGIDRKRKSKWMIVVMFALFTPLAIDFIILIAAPTLLGPLFGQILGE